MALLGQSALAMWWTIAPAIRAEFEDWHAHEHFPERLSLPGFLRGSRWSSANGSGGVFVMYELEHHDVLTSPEYRARLDAPTPWSTRMMPHHTGMVRSQTRVVESFGSGVGGNLATVRLSPGGIGEPLLQNRLRDALRELPAAKGVTGAHFLKTDTPAAPLTTEQRIRGADAAADWIVLLSGYDLAAIETIAMTHFSATSLGLADTTRVDTFRLAYALSKTDL